MKFFPSSTQEHIGLYVHVPFCLKKCDYCSFYSCSPQPGDIDAYLEGIREEYQRRMTSDRLKHVSTVFIGGGNPTILGLSGLSGLIDILTKSLPTSQIQEWTIETNPETFTPDLLPLLKDLPHLRLSMGIQRFRDRELALLGRAGTFQVAEKALDKAFSVTANIGIDLILGIPGCPSPAFDLQNLLERFPLTHLSSYFLTVEENTQLERRVLAGELDDPQEMGPEDLLEVREVLKAAGLRHYEISNFARPGLECRHNLQYWYQNDYLGLGPAAVSTFNKLRLTNRKGIRTWNKEAPEVEVLDPLTKAKEFLMLRLRLLEKGFYLEEFQQHHGKLTGTFCTALERQYLEGHLDSEKRIRGQICLTTRGLVVANQVLSELMEAME